MLYKPNTPNTSERKKQEATRDEEFLSLAQVLEKFFELGDFKSEEFQRFVRTLGRSKIEEYWKKWKTKKKDLQNSNTGVLQADGKTDVTS